MARAFNCKPVVFRFPECITGHHVYKYIWKPVIGETLTCDIEPQNIQDPYFLKVIFQGLVVGLVPRFL